METELVLQRLHQRLHAALGNVLADLGDRQIQARAAAIDARPIW